MTGRYHVEKKNTGKEIFTALRHRIEATPFTLPETINDVVGCLVGKGCSGLHTHRYNAMRWPS